MKKLMFFTALLMFQFSLNAQIELEKIGISFGKEPNKVSNFSAQSLLSNAHEGLNSQISEQFNLSNSYQHATEHNSPNFKFSMVLVPSKWKSMEFHTTAAFALQQKDGVSLYDKDATGLAQLNIDAFSHELGLAASLVQKKSYIGFLHFYGGLGLNTGYRFGNRLALSGSEQPYSTDGSVPFNNTPLDIASTYTDINNGIAIEGFAQGGFGISLLKIVEIGYERLQGYGFQQYFGSQAAYAHSHSNRFTIKYNLGNKKKKEIFSSSSKSKKTRKGKKKSGKN